MERIAFGKYLFGIACTTVFAYLLLDSLLVMRFSGPFSRIDLLTFLIPHASKVALWSGATLLFLRPKFGWRFPFAMLFLYCCAELLTNWIWFLTHIPFGYVPAPDFRILFPLSNAFFILAFIFCYLFLRGHFYLKFDWSILPFGVFVASWIITGYQTESTIAYPSYWLETEEFIWTVLYLLMALNVFKSKS